MTNFARFCILTPHDEPRGARIPVQGLWGVSARRTQGWLLRPCRQMAPLRGQFWTFLSSSQVGLKKPIFGPKLLGDDGGAIPSAQRGNQGPPSEEHGESFLNGPGAHQLLTTRPQLVGTPLLWQGSRVTRWKVCQLCLNPRTSKPLRRWDLGLGYGLRRGVYYPEAPLPHSMAQRT